MLEPVEWIGSSKADLKRIPDPLRRRTGFATYQAQAGLRHHAFQKKARRGIATPKQELDLVRRRLRAAERHYRDTHRGD